MRVSSPGPSEYDSDKPIASRSLLYDKRFAAWLFTHRTRGIYWVILLLGQLAINGRVSTPVDGQTDGGYNRAETANLASPLYLNTFVWTILQNNVEEIWRICGLAPKSSESNPIFFIHA